jgi:hypothetical protein
MARPAEPFLGQPLRQNRQREKGTPNRLSRETKGALVEAAARIGSDGTGKDGVVGYGIWAAKRDETFFYFAQAPRLAGVLKRHAP